MTRTSSRNRSLPLVSLTAVLLGVTSYAYAIDSIQEAIVTPGYAKNTRTSQMKHKTDAGRDEKLTMEEGEAYVRNLFVVFDTNHDGVLDQSEWKGASRNAEVRLIVDGRLCAVAASHGDDEAR